MKKPKSENLATITGLKKNLSENSRTLKRLNKPLTRIEKERTTGKSTKKNSIESSEIVFTVKKMCLYPIDWNLSQVMGKVIQHQA